MRKWLCHLFVPQERNNFRAKLLHPSFLAFLVGFFLFNQTVLNLIALTKPGVLGYASSISPETIVALTNQERAKSNLVPLSLNSSLNESARRKAGDMLAFDYWAHDSPSGRSPWDFIREVGYGYKAAGENLAKDFADSGGVVAAWMNSSTHRANIMDARFTEIGVAVVDGTLRGYQTTLVVQHFAKPVNAVAQSGVAAQEPVVDTMATNSDQKIKPTLIPTAVPTAVLLPTEVLEREVDSKSLALVQGEEFSLEQVPTRKIINPLLVTKIISAFLFGMILLAIGIDVFYIVKTGTHRLSGRSLAHALFLALVFLLIVLSQQGVIN